MLFTHTHAYPLSWQMFLSKCLRRLTAAENTALAAFRCYGSVPSLEPLSDDEFFNREQERSYLSNLFERKPSAVNVVLGGPSTGKSALLHKVLHDTSKFRVVHFDLRAEVFTDWPSLHDSLLTKFRSLFPELKLPNVEVSVMDSVSVKLRKHDEPYRQSLKQLKDLLNTIAKDLPSWTFWHGTSTKPVLFIDEANVLHVLERGTTEDREALEALLRWSVLMTKQHQKFHVVLASSDSFFWEWLAKPELNIQSHSQAHVVGDLVRSEAQKFFDRECERLGIDICFEKVYEQTGGRILHITSWLEHYKRVGGKIIDSPWAMVSAQRNVLDRDFREQKTGILREIMENLACKGFMPLTAAPLSSENTVRDLVRRNIIGLRPKRAIVADIEGDIPDALHLVPRMPVDRFVLREILGRLA